MLRALVTLLSWVQLACLVGVALCILSFAVQILLYIVARLLLAYCRWQEVRKRNRKRKAVGLPPLSGIHKGHVPPGNG